MQKMFQLFKKIANGMTQSRDAGGKEVPLYLEWIRFL